MMASSSERTLLPLDLVEEILCRVPVEYLIRFQLVCKQWHSLFKSKRFIYRYSDLVQERFIRIGRMVQIFDPVTQTRLISRMPDKLRNVLPIFTLVHCDGLLLLKFNYASVMGKLAIWNPVLGQVKWIQPRIPYLHNDTYGFGYDNVSRDDYKILRFCEAIYDYGNESKKCYGVTLEIYSIKSNSWRIVDNDTSFDWAPDPLCRGVSVNGNMYWMAAHRSSDANMFIQSFDFSTETFKPKSCLPFECYPFDTIALSCFRRDKLSLLHQCAETKKIEIWVSNRVDNEVMSWSKYLSFASPDMPAIHSYGRLILHPADPEYFIDKNDKIRVCSEEKTEDESGCVIRVYEIGRDGIKKEEKREGFDPQGRNETPFLHYYVYVPSLVPLPQ